MTCRRKRTQPSFRQYGMSCSASITKNQHPSRHHQRPCSYPKPPSPIRVMSRATAWLSSGLRQADAWRQAPRAWRVPGLIVSCASCLKSVATSTRSGLWGYHCRKRRSVSFRVVSCRLVLSASRRSVTLGYIELWPLVDLRETVCIWHYGRRY